MVETRSAATYDGVGKNPTTDGRVKGTEHKKAFTVERATRSEMWTWHADVFDLA